MNDTKLNLVRVCVLKAGELTPNIFSFQYYPAAIYRPAFKPFEEELKRQMKIPFDRPIWVYHHNAQSSTLVPVGAEHFAEFVSHRFIRVFVETERPLAGPELVLNIPTFPELGNLGDAIAKDRMGDPSEINEYAEKLGKLAERIVQGIELGDGDLERMLVCTKERPFCEKCRKRVGHIWYLNKKTFGALCKEDADSIAMGDPLGKELFMMYTNSAFKYERQFEELKRDFGDVPDERIRHLLWINLGSVDNVRAVLSSKFKFGVKEHF